MPPGRFSKLQSGSGNVIQPDKLTPPPGTVGRQKKGGHEVPLEEDDRGYAGFIQLADEAFYSGRYREALRYYSRALQDDNSHVVPWIGQISALIELKQYKEAELWTNRALENFPEDPSVLSQRARMLALTGNLKRAIGVSDYALGIGGSPWAWLARGEVLVSAGEKNALFCFDKAVEAADAERWRILLEAGRCYLRRRQWASAEPFLRRAAETKPDNFFVWYEYAIVLTELNFTDRARDAIERCLQLRSDFRAAKDLEIKLYRRPFLKRLLGILRR